MTRLRPIVRSLAGGVLAIAETVACGTSRSPLPPAPPPVAVAELATWGRPPPLAPEEHAKVHLAIRHFKLANGVGVTVAETKDTATSLALQVPAARDRSHGAVTAMVLSLRAGTRDGSNEPFFDPKVALTPIDFWTDVAGTTFTWRVPQRATRQALSLLGSFALEPFFEPSEVRLRLQQQLAQIRDASEPLHQLRELARAAIPRLERPSDEQDARGLFHLDPATLKQIHRCAFQPVKAELVMVGPISAEDALGWATNALGRWRAEADATSVGCANWVTPPFPERPEEARRERPLLVEIYGLAGDPRFVIDVPGPPLESADYMPFELLASVLQEHRSGSAKALRHAGATYGIRVDTYDRYPRASLLEAEGQVRPEQAQNALRGLIDDIRGIARRLNAAELDTVKRRWRTQTIDSWSRSDDLAGALAWQLRRGRAAEDLPKVLDEVQQIDVARCAEVAERYLTHAQPSIAVTGLSQSIARGLGLDMDVRRLAWTNKLKER